MALKDKPTDQLLKECIFVQNPKAFVDWMKFFNRLISDYRRKAPESTLNDETIVALMLVHFIKEGMVSESENGYFMLGEWDNIDKELEKIEVDLN